MRRRNLYKTLSNIIGGIGAATVRRACASSWRLACPGELGACGVGGGEAEERGGLPLLLLGAPASPIGPILPAKEENMAFY